MITTTVRCVVVSVLMTTVLADRPAALPLPLPDGNSSPSLDSSIRIPPATGTADTPFRPLWFFSDGSRGSVMSHVGPSSTSSTLWRARQTEPFDTAIHPSDSVFHATPRGGVFNFAVAAPQPPRMLATFFVNAVPVDIATDQELAAAVISSDGLKDMPFYVYVSVTRQ